MKCVIDGRIVDCKVIKNLGFQGGMYAKVVLYDGKEIVVTSDGGAWVKHTPSFIAPSGFTDPMC